MTGAATALGLLVVLAGVAGCGTTQRQVVYEKAGLTVAERQRDLGECFGESTAVQTSPLLSVQTAVPVDRAAYDACMTGRGYRVRDTRR